MFGYTFLSLIAFMDLPWKIKIPIGLIMLGVALFHLWARTFFGGAFNMDMPFGLYFMLAWPFVSLVILFLLALLKDIIALFLWLLRRCSLQIRLPWSRNARTLVLVVLALLLGGYSFWQAIRAPEVYTEDLVLQNLPPELDGFSIVQITDPHASSILRAPRVRTIVDRANAAKPDLIVLTGDLIDGYTQDRREEVAPLADLRAPYGVLACLGNHEYYWDARAWKSKYRELGLTLLDNRHVLLEVHGQPLVVTGVTDPTARRFNMPEPDIEAALAGAPPEAFKIVLAHQTRGAKDNAAAGVNLQLSGHTHGGHLWPMIWLVRLFNDGFAHGRYEVGNMTLYVSPGAGIWLGFPGRLGVPGEITRLVLRSPHKAATSGNHQDTP